MYTNFCFSEILLVAAANRFKVLKIFISLKVTAYIQDRRLRSEKALHVKGFERKSNCTEMAKYANDFKHKMEGERERERERERESERGCKTENLAKQFTLHSADAYSEPFPTCKQGGYLIIGGNYFHKNIHLRCLKRF